MAAAKSAGVVPFLIVFGGESYLIDQERARARRTRGHRVVEVVGEGLTDADLVDLLREGSLDGERLVLVDEAQAIKGDKALKAYLEAGEYSSPLVALIRGEKLPDVWAKAGHRGRVIEHAKLKTWDDNNQVVKWIAAEAVRRKVTLKTGMAEQLYRRLGADLYRLANELGKLGRLDCEIGPEQVALVSSIVVQGEPWQVAEATFARDKNRAMDLLALTYKSGGPDMHVPVTAALQRQAEKLTAARDLLDRKVGFDDIAAAVGLNAYRFKNSVLPLVRRHTLPDLIRHMGRLRTLEMIVKGPSLAKRVHVELAVLSVVGLGVPHGNHHHVAHRPSSIPAPGGFPPALPRQGRRVLQYPGAVHLPDEVLPGG